MQPIQRNEELKHPIRSFEWSAQLTIPDAADETTFQDYWEGAGLNVVEIRRRPVVTSPKNEYGVLRLRLRRRDRKEPSKVFRYIMPMLAIKIFPEDDSVFQNH